MFKKKHGKLIEFGLFISVLLLVHFAGEVFFGVPRSDHYFLLQNIIYFFLSLFVSGAILAYLSEGKVRVVFACNTVLLLIVYIFG